MGIGLSKVGGFVPPIVSIRCMKPNRLLFRSLLYDLDRFWYIDLPCRYRFSSRKKQWITCEHTVVGSEIPSNHRLDGAETLQIMGYLPYQLVNAGFLYFRIFVSCLAVCAGPFASLPGSSKWGGGVGGPSVTSRVLLWTPSLMLEKARFYYRDIWVFPKMVGFPNSPWGFPTKNDQHLGCFGDTTM